MGTTTRITYDQFEEMVRRGAFAGAEEHYELLFGEIAVLPLPEPPHEAAIDRLNEGSFEGQPRGAAWVRVQQSLGIPAFDSVPLPDVAWMRRRDYSQQRPLPKDILLLIEVSDSTLSRDRGLKARLYAAAGIADYGIINMPGRCVEVRRDPEGDAYRTIEVLRPGQEARPLAFPQIVPPIARLFPV